MILTDKIIMRYRVYGAIIIDDFKEDHLNPNSYDLTLAPTLLTPRNNRKAFDLNADDHLDNYNIIRPDGEGKIYIKPHTLYLGVTNEYTETRGLVPGVEGKSSLARLGLAVHVTAGFGDVGFCGHWTLEIFSLRPLIIYPNMRICQIYYDTIYEEGVQSYQDTGRYNNEKQSNPLPKLYKSIIKP